MFNSKTVFVIGAGAGEDIGMPVGRQLADTISAKMALTDNGGGLVGHGDNKLFEEVAKSIGRDTAAKAALRLSRGLPFVKSIDEFLDYNVADWALVHMGKAAIVRSILEAERGSRILDTTTNPTRPSFVYGGPAYHSWLMRLIRMLGQGDPARLFENVTFINFNYDRSLEFFLLNAMRSLYDVSEDDARTLVASADIFHPYGTVGTLKVFDDTHGIGYGWTLGKSEPLVGGIRTYTEEIKDQARLQQVHSRLHLASTIVFLGFAFHQQNMDLLKPETPLGPKKIFATAYGISEADSGIVRQRLSKLFADPVVWGNMNRANIVHLRLDCKCADLMDQYQLTLPNI